MELYTKKGGRYFPADADCVRDAALATLELSRGDAITSPASTADYLKLRLAGREHEMFCVLFLDNRHRVILFDEIFRGTIDSTSVYPREVVKEALAVNAAAVILVHNHPSGVAEPSQADERITRRIKTALELVDIRVLDHMIVAGDKCVSLASRGVV
jgi:DNA repair protein RadC